MCPTSEISTKRCCLKRATRSCSSCRRKPFSPATTSVGASIAPSSSPNASARNGRGEKVLCSGSKVHWRPPSTSEVLFSTSKSPSSSLSSGFCTRIRPSAAFAFSIGRFFFCLVLATPSSHPRRRVEGSLGLSSGGPSPSTRVSDFTLSGRAAAYITQAEPPIECPTRCTGSELSCGRSSSRSSA